MRRSYMCMIFICSLKKQHKPTNISCWALQIFLQGFLISSIYRVDNENLLLVMRFSFVLCKFYFHILNFLQILAHLELPSLTQFP